MQTALECVPCLVRQSLESAQLVSSDPVFQEQVLRDTMRHINELSFEKSPPEIAATVHREIRRRLGDPDPYRTQKRHFNELARSILPALEREIAGATDPFERALHIAIAGNVVDFGVTAAVNESDLHDAIEAVAENAVKGDVEELRRAVAGAERILYLADNTGEIVFDRLLIQQLPVERVTVAVRGAPIINDATYEDAVFAGITDLVPVITNGADAPGTVLSMCSDPFVREFSRADLIISKGQGNFETLEDVTDRPIAFLFRVKCPVAQRLSGYPMGSHVVLFNQGNRSEG